MGFLTGLTLAKVAPALIGAGSSLISNLFGKNSQDKANATNVHLNQLNNEFNERMMQKQMDYNTMMYNRQFNDNISLMDRQNQFNVDMWNMQNAYNSPSAQRSRLQAAGINPYMMLNGGNAGVASSVGSTSASGASPQGVSAASASSFAGAKGYNFDFSGIPAALLQSKQAKLLEQQTENQRLDNLTKMKRDLASLTNLQLQGVSQSTRNRIDNIKANYVNQMEQEQLQLMRVNREARREEMQETIAKRLLLDKELAIFDEQTKLEFAQMAANTLNTSSRTAFTKQQQVHEIQKMYKTIAERNGIKISNDVARRTAESIVEKARYDAYYDASSPFGLIQRIGQRVDNYFK